MQTISRAARANGWTAAAAWALVAWGALLAARAPSAEAAITDLSTWTLVQDPPNANFTVTPHPTAKILLAGNGAVPSGTDIGYQSVNGPTPAASTAGHAFDPAASFSVAIDYTMSFANTPSGGLAIGFGIGED